MFLGIDLGTGSLKCLLMDEAGATVAQASAAYASDAPAPGQGEIPVERWTTGLRQALTGLPGQARRAVRAIGLSGQMHGLVLVDAQGTALRPALLWTDQRAADWQTRVPVAACGNPFAPGMAGPMLGWLAEHEAATLVRTRWALQPKDWLGFYLTGTACGDASDASATLLADIHGTWDAASARRYGADPRILPPLRPSTAERGVLRASIAAELGLPAGVPVAVGAGDTPAALVGTGLIDDGDAQLTTGTGAQLVVLRTMPPVPHPALHRYRSAYPADCAAPLPQWYAMAAMQNGGVALEWARSMLRLSWDEAYSLAFEPGLRETGAIFIPYLTGERSPWMNPAARGAWVGLSPADDAGTLMRAAFRGVAFGLRAGYAALCESGHAPARLLLAGGGSLHAKWRQLLADTLGCPLTTLPQANASARGAALLGALALGHWQPADLAELALPPGLIVEPVHAETERATVEYHRFLAWYERLGSGV